MHNPVQALAEILAQLHDANGTITVPGFYDDVVPLTDEERELLAKIPKTEAEFMAEGKLSALWGEKEYTVLERVGARPTLEINGMIGGFTGDGQKTVIGKSAMAKVSCRLVANQDPDKIFDLLKRHITNITPDSITSEVKRLGAHAELCQDAEYSGGDCQMWFVLHTRILYQDSVMRLTESATPLYCDLRSN